MRITTFSPYELRRKLKESGFRPPADFAILRDVTGKKIWDYVAPWGEEAKAPEPVKS